MTTLRFTDQDGSDLGRVIVDGENLRASEVTLRQLIKAWRRRGGTATDFLAKYDGWSNGYVTARREER